MSEWTGVAINELPFPDRPIGADFASEEEEVRFRAAIFWGPLPAKEVLDGKQVAEWIDHCELGVEDRLGKNLTRTYKRWRDGTSADAKTVDKVLGVLGRSISELPREFWIDRPPCRPRGSSSTEQAVAA